MLRLVSFNMDYYWARNRVGTPDVLLDIFAIASQLTLFPSLAWIRVDGKTAHNRLPSFRSIFF